ncbi:MAG: tetratricopeptide repeat protein [Bdellovibrionales bacterium]|nr:tetratricopeptide repeat protein [Bdellovibrionales bacterium]
MNKTNHKLFFYLFIALLIFPQSKAAAKSKKTIGQLLSQVSMKNRGGKLSSSEKGRVNIPQNNTIEFEKLPVHHNLESIKPVKSYEIIQSENISQMVEYEKVLDEQINELYKLTKKFRNSNNRGELWLRLAELYVEKGSLVDYRKQKEFDRKLELYNQKKTRVKPKLETAESQSYFKKSVQLYEWFQKDFPNDPKVPQALYFLGFNYFQLGVPSKGEKYYERLADKYSRSPFVDESNFALAEYYFELEKWKEAYKRYAPVIKNKHHNLNLMATYKGAWCLFRLGRSQQALKYMEYVINESRNDSNRKQGKAKLEGEALRDIVVFYAAAGNPDRAADYFKNMVGDQKANSYMEKLAYYYLDKGQREAARSAFQYLISIDPNSPKAFEYQYQIVQVYFYSKNSPEFKKELYTWIKDYGPTTTWYQSNQNNKELMDNSMKLREKTLRSWTLQQHQTAQNSRTKHSRNAALEGYQLYLSEFQNSSLSSDMHFYYGELLYDMKRFDEAGIQYKWVVDNAPQSKFYEKSATNLLISVERSLPSDKELERKNSQGLEPIPLSPTVDRFIKASSWYISKLPNSKKVPEIKFRQGRLMYQYNYFEDANKVFKEIVTKYPKTKYAEYSANLMLDIYNLKKDYSGLEMAATELLKNESLASTKAGAEIKEVLEKASFKKAQDLEQNSKLSESADTFASFAKENPKSNLAITAWYNSGVNYEKSGEKEKAKNSYLAVINSRQSNKDLKQKSKLFVAKLYQDSALYDESIKLYLQLISENPRSKENQNYLYNVAVMKEAQEKFSQAIKYYEEYNDGVKNWREKLELMFTLAELNRKSNKLTASQNLYKEYISNNPSDGEKLVEAYYWVSNIYVMRGSSQSYQWEDKMLAIQTRLSSRGKDVGNKWAAKVKLKRAHEIFSDLKEIKIPSQPEQQKKAVDKKISLLNKLNKDLNEVVKLNSPEEIISSLTLLGHANDNMANAIMNSPIPKGLDGQLAKQYKESLPKLAEPFLNRAKESYKLAVTRAFEFETYSTDFEKSYQYMNKLEPKKYYDSGEKSFDIRFINWMSL